MPRTRTPAEQLKLQQHLATLPPRRTEADLDWDTCPMGVVVTHTCHGAIFLGTPRGLAQRECPACTPEPVSNYPGDRADRDAARPQRTIAWDRDEHDPCQASTPGCAIDHALDTGSCEGW